MGRRAMGLTLPEVALCLRSVITLLSLSYSIYKHQEVEDLNKDNAEKRSESGSTGSNLASDRNRKYLQKERQQLVRENTFMGAGEDGSW